MPLRYAVETCIDDPTALHVLLNDAVESNGRALNVMWLPGRELPADENGFIHRLSGGYVIVLEYFE